MPRGQIGDEPARLRDAPRRAVGAVRRLLRMPAEATRRHEQQAERDHATAAAIAAMSARLAAIDDVVTDLRVAMDSNRAELTTALASVERLLGTQRDAVDDLARIARDADDHAVVLIGEHRDAVRRLAATSAAIADHLAATDAHRVPEGPLVTVVVPVRDRPDEVVRALASLQAQTYERWECIVVDDGSEQAVEKTIGDLADDRITVVRVTPRGAAAARNVAIERATGDLITFLDSDNEWFPARLARVVEAMAARPWAGWATDGQLLDDSGNGLPFVRDTRAPLRGLDLGNFIDGGALVIRRRLLDEVGGFDPELQALGDWDLIRRLAQVERPARLPTIGYRYHDEQGDRISVREPHGPPWHRVRRKAIGQPAEGLRVLAAEWQHPQLTETYIESDLAGLRQLGAHVEVWSEEDVAVPYEASVPVHRGDLADAISATRPDIVLSHWLHMGRRFREVTRRAGVPHAVRAHGFEFDREPVDALLRDPGVVVHLAPHHIGPWAGHPRAVVTPVAFDARRYPPRREKDRRLVVRVVAGQLSKDLEVFVATAERCPQHRFVLAVGHTYMKEAKTEQVVELVRASGAPVEVHTDLSHDEAADLVGSAGIYLHTIGTAHPMGMPISIAEALATGAVVVARDLPGMSAYLGPAGARYRGDSVEDRADHAAAIINDTLMWDEGRWANAWMTALDHAWQRHPSDIVAADMLAAWQEKLGVRAR